MSVCVYAVTSDQKSDTPTVLVVKRSKYRLHNVISALLDKLSSAVLLWVWFLRTWRFRCICCDTSASSVGNTVSH